MPVTFYVYYKHVHLLSTATETAYLHTVSFYENVITFIGQDFYFQLFDNNRPKDNL